MAVDESKIKVIPGSGTHYREAILTTILHSFAYDVLERLPLITAIELSYDNQQDFYHCKFQYNGKNVDVRFYKVFAVEVDGKEIGIWSRNNTSSCVRILAVHIR